VREPERAAAVPERVRAVVRTTSVAAGQLEPVADRTVTDPENAPLARSVLERAERRQLSE
jgi:hypothetical protein